MSGKKPPITMVTFTDGTTGQLRTLGGQYALIETPQGPFRLNVHRNQERAGTRRLSEESYRRFLELKASSSWGRDNNRERVSLLWEKIVRYRQRGHSIKEAARFYHVPERLIYKEIERRGAQKRMRLYDSPAAENILIAHKNRRKKQS